MSEERLLDAIGQVKDKFIEEAAPKGLLNNEEKVRMSGITSGKAQKYKWLKWGALAASLCIIAGLGMKMTLFSAKTDSALEGVNQMKPATGNGTAESGMPNYSFSESNKADRADITMDNTTKSDSGKDYNTTSAETESKENIKEDKGFPDWGVTLYVKNVTSAGLTLVVTQSGGNPTGSLETGEPYRLITLEDGTWKTVEELPLPEGVDGRGFNSIAYLIPKNETREFAINWEWIFGELPNGTYRLIKEFIDFREAGNYDTFEYWVEFEIN